MTRERGSLGQFDVLVDGELIARRERTRWPDPEDVVGRIDELRRRKAGG